MMATGAPENVAALEARLHSLSSRRAALHARVSELDVTIAEVADLASEVEIRIREQESEVARLMLAAGRPISFGADHTQRSAFFTAGGRTEQISGPRPLDSPRGAADHARRVLAALEQEAAPIRSTLVGLQNERHRAQREIALLGGEVNPVEVQISRIRAEEAERAQLIGERLTWRSRLATIARRMGHVGA